MIELLIVITLIITLGLELFNKKIYRASLISILLGLFVAHFRLEGIRWTMALSYGVFAFYFYCVIVKKELKKFTYILSGIGIILTLILISLFRYNSLPEPLGDYQIGTFAFDIEDENRVELYGDRKGDKRKIRVQVWYPASYIAYEERAKWLFDGGAVAEGLPGFYGLPEFLLRYSAKIESNSYIDPLLSDAHESYPVIIISHGWTGFRNLHNDLAETFASSGYIVASIDHTYGALATVFEDGSLVKVDKDALPNAETVDNFPEYSNTLVTTYALDSQLTLDILESLNDGHLASSVVGINKSQEDMFMHKLDMSEVGLIGHSTGGGEITLLAMTDDRIQAVFGFDPWVEPIGFAKLEEGLALPSMFIRSEQWADRVNNVYLETIAKAENTQTKMYQLNGSSHQDFSMMYMYKPLVNILGFTGELDSMRSQEIQHKLVLAFMNKELKDLEDDPDKMAQNYEEVIDIYFPDIDYEQ